MNLMQYLGSIRDQIGAFNVEEDHKIKVCVVRSAKALTEKQKERVSELVFGLQIKYVTGNI